MTGTKLAVFVQKLNSTGTAVLYSTFLGGSVDPYGSASNDQPTKIAVDKDGNAIVTGWTSSTDFPMKNAIAAGVPSFEYGFLTSISPDGSALNFSSRIGGSPSGSSSALTFPNALTIDTSGNVYLAGITESAYLPTTPGALQNATPSYGNTTGFLMKLSQSGVLGFGAILGQIGRASGGVGPSAVAVDANGVIYLVGTAGATVFSTPTTTPWPTTPGAYQRDLISPSENAPFVTRVSADGSAIVSSTLVGAGSASGLALTSTGDVILAGSANYNFPLTADAYNSNVSKCGTSGNTAGALGYVAKVSSDGSTLLYSSAFGPTDTLVSINGVGQDVNGNVWLAGTVSGSMTDLVHPLESVKSLFDGAGFVSEFDSTLHTLLFETYVNSATGSSQVNGLALDLAGHVAGVASQDFPTTANGFLRTVTAPPPNFTYAYGFAAMIDASSPGPGLCFAKPVTPPVLVGSSGTGSFDIVNCGDGPLNVFSLQLASSVFTLNPNGCTGQLAAGQSCTVAYRFTPTKMGSAAAQVLIASDAPMGPASYTITELGTAPIASVIGSTTYTFPTQVLGAPTQTGTVSIANKGTAPLIINTSSTSITG